MYVVARGLASHLRLKLKADTACLAATSRQGPGISSEIETLIAVHYADHQRRQGPGISSEIETCYADPASGIL